MFDIDCGQVGGFLLSTTVSSTNNANSHDIIEKLLKVALSIYNPISTPVSE
jgi:hypothetical protein